jgi:hypothetical protein
MFGWERFLVLGFNFFLVVYLYLHFRNLLVEHSYDHFHHSPRQRRPNHHHLLIDINITIQHFHWCIANLPTVWRLGLDRPDHLRLGAELRLLKPLLLAVLGRYYDIDLDLKHFQCPRARVPAVWWDRMDGADGVLDGVELRLFE